MWVIQKKTKLIVKVNKEEIKVEDRKLTLMGSIFKGLFSEYIKQLNRKKVEYYWIEIKNDKVIRLIGFDIFKRPVKNSNKLKLEFSLDFKKNERIELTHFDDIYKLMNVRDFELLKNTHKKYLDYWNKCEYLEPPKFPIFSYDSNNITDSIVHFQNSSDIIKDSDANGYEWNESENIIDSNRNEYEVQYLNFGHPMGVVIPKRIIRRLTENEIKEVMES